MRVFKRDRFIQAMREGDKDTFNKLLPKMQLSELAVKRILKINMVWKHDFIIKKLFLKKYIHMLPYLEDLLFFAIVQNYELGVAQALKKGAFSNGLFRNRDLLVVACKKGNKEIIMLLLEHGANPNLKKDGINSPLSTVLKRLDMELVEMLQAYGAILDKELLNLELVTAAKANRIDLVDQFLLKGALFKEANYIGLVFTHCQSIEYVLKRDFTFTLCMEFEFHFFSLAARFGQLNNIRLFIKYGRLRTPTDEFIRTISVGLFAAARQGHLEIVKYLLSQGANLNYVHHNQTPYDAAIGGNQLKVANYLYKFGGRSFVEQ